MADKRHTRIDFKSLRNLPGSFVEPGKGRSGLDESKNNIVIPPPGGVRSRPEERLQLARPVRFPIKAYGDIKSASPWSSYERVYSIQLGNSFQVTVAEKKTFPYENCSVRRFPGAIDKDQIQMLQQIRHANFVTVLEAFRFEEITHVVFEHMPVSLHEIARIGRHVDTIHLAAILGQVVNGLAYLSEQRLEHGSLTSSNILVSSEGAVKIAGYECCYRRASESAEMLDIRALSRITAELMHGHVKENGVVGVADPSIWDAVVIDFLSETTSAASVEELKKHPLLKLRWEKEKLKRLVSIAMMSVHFSMSW